MSQRDDGAGTALQKAPLAGIDRVFGRDLRSEGWVVDVPSGLDGESAQDAGDAIADEAPLSAIMWALRARRK